MRVVYRTAAGNDAEAARRWYDQQQPGLGATFQEELTRAETLLRSHPAAFPTVHRDYRRLILTLSAGEVRPLAGDEILHARRLPAPLP